MAEGSTRVYDWMMAPHRRVIAAQARGSAFQARHAARMPVAAGADQPDHRGLRLPAPRAAAAFSSRGAAALRRIDAGAAAPAPHAAAGPGPALRVRLARHPAGPALRLFRRIAKACRRLDAQLLVAHCGGLDAAQERLEARRRQLGVRLRAAARGAGARRRRGLACRPEHGDGRHRARTPILALPIAFDQPGAAARILHAGIGLRASPRLAGAATSNASCGACSMNRFGSASRCWPAAGRAGGAGARPTSSKRRCACAAAKSGAQPWPRRSRGIGAGSPA
jgi:zeaxanthin glucosyltransferase